MNKINSILIKSFHCVNLILIVFYLYPGSIFGYVLYKNSSIQPQITRDFLISSNHFYVFIFISTLGFLSFIKQNQTKNLIIYLLFLSIILEILHLFIPDRSYQWSDLFGNLLGVIIVIIFNNLINKYDLSKK